VEEIPCKNDEAGAGNDHNGGRRHSMFARAFSVFNVAQPDGYQPSPVPVLLESERLRHAGIAHRPRPEHAAYVKSWVQALKDDPRAIFTAASKAQRALIGCTRSSPSRLASEP